MKILLVDPDEYYHQEFREILADFAELVVAREARAARALLHEAPDLCVMELLLSDEPGYEILKELRGLLPVVIFSRLDHPEDIEAALALGVTGYFVKGRDSVSDVKQLLLNYSF